MLTITITRTLASTVLIHSSLVFIQPRNNARSYTVRLANEFQP